MAILQQLDCFKMWCWSFSLVVKIVKKSCGYIDLKIEINLILIGHVQNWFTPKKDSHMFLSQIQHFQWRNPLQWLKYDLLSLGLQCQVVKSLVLSAPLSAKNANVPSLFCMNERTLAIVTNCDANCYTKESFFKIASWILNSERSLKAKNFAKVSALPSHETNLSLFPFHFCFLIKILQKHPKIFFSHLTSSFHLSHFKIFFPLRDWNFFWYHYSLKYSRVFAQHRQHGRSHFIGFFLPWKVPKLGYSRLYSRGLLFLQS